MFKAILQQTNRALAKYNKSETPSLWTFWHKWNYQHTLVKNLLQFSNRVLKQVNKYHVFRWDWMVGIAGAATGFIVIHLQQVYYQIKIGYKPTTSNIVINNVLRNPTVSNKLKQALNTNVFYNQQLQYYVHQTLLNQVISPQKQQIKQLIKTAIQNLNTHQSVDNLGTILSTNVPILTKPIKDASLQFLDSPTMDSITANGIKSALQSLFFKQFLANQINMQIKTFLSDQKNGEYLYQLMKDKFSI